MKRRLSGRKAELSYLNASYEQPGSDVLVIYGPGYVGKTALLNRFAEGKPAFFYDCRDCSPRQQLFFWGQELDMEGIPDPKEVLDASCISTTEKNILILNEFQYIAKNEPDFGKEIAGFLKGLQEKEVLIILVCSSIIWVENAMERKISGFDIPESNIMKLKDVDFFSMIEMFPEYSREDAVKIYSILGGYPGLWEFFDPKKTVEKNICDVILDSRGALHNEVERVLSKELREVPVYQTIMSSLAQGMNKLNDLHHHTGFSRAKISVYLKNLIQMEIVEKVVSYDTEGWENSQKGIYRLNNGLLRFYYRFVLPHSTDLIMMGPELFYKNRIQKEFRSFCEFGFKIICTSYLIREARKGSLPITVTQYGEWIGKAGHIDVIMQDKRERTLLALCSWEKEIFDFSDYKALLEEAERAVVHRDYVYLFTESRFDEKFYMDEKAGKGWKLISLQSM